MDNKDYNFGNAGHLIGRVLALTDYILGYPDIHGEKLPDLVFRNVPKLIYWHTQALKKVAMDLPEITPEGDELMNISEQLMKVKNWEYHHPGSPHSEMFTAYYKTREDIQQRAIRLPIGRAIVAERMRQDMSQTELAKRSDLSNNNVRRIEQGKYNYTIDNLTKVADSLGMEVRLVKKGETEGEPES